MKINNQFKSGTPENATVSLLRDTMPSLSISIKQLKLRFASCIAKLKTYFW